MSEQTQERQPVSIRRFLGDTAVYGLVEVADKAIGFLLLPLTTHILTEADYGVLSIFGTTAQLLSLTIALGMQSTFLRFYSEQTSEEGKVAILNSVYRIATISSLIWILPMLSLSRWLGPVIFDQDSVTLVIFLGCNAYLDLFNSLGMCRLRMEGKATTFLWISILSTLCKRGSGLYLLVKGYGAFGWIVGEFFGLLITSTLMTFFVLQGLRFTKHASLLRTLLPFGAGLVPVSISHWLMISSDKYLIKEMMQDGMRFVGYYGVGERISSIMALINMAFILGWQRFAYHNMHLADGPRLIARSATVFITLTGFGSMALAMLGDDITYWGRIDPKFFPGLPVIPVLTFAGLWWGMGDIAGIGLMKTNRTRALATLNLTAAVINVALIYVLIPKLGIVGAAAATCICQFLKTVAIFILSHKHYPVPFEYRRIGIAFLVFGTIFVAGYFGLSPRDLNDSKQWVIATATQATLVAIAPLLLWLCGFFQPEEKEVLRQLLLGNFKAALRK